MNQAHPGQVHVGSFQADQDDWVYRRGPPAGGEGVDIGTTADFLAALEARANSRTAGDAPSRAHRCGIALGMRVRRFKH